MAILKDSWHFTPVDQIPQIDGLTPFREVYQLLSQSGRGGFLLLDEGKAQNYVKAYELADAVVRHTVKDVNQMTWLSQSERDLALIEQFKIISDTSIKEIVRNASRWTPVVPVDQAPIDVIADEQELRAQDERVFDVQEAGESIGWYLNHETVKHTLTEKPVFICKNGHRNPNSDHGTCHYCSASFSDVDRQ